MIGVVGGMRIVCSVCMDVAGMQVAPAGVEVAAEIMADIAAKIGMTAKPYEAQQELQYEYGAAQGGTDGE
jgi:hypothetical protein